MAAWYKATMIFDYVSGETGSAVRRSGGWTESWYCIAQTPAGAFDLLTQNKVGIPALAQARAGILCGSCSIVGCRIQQVKPSVAASTSHALRIPGNKTPAFAADVPQMAILVRLNTTTTDNIKSNILRGLPDSMVTFGEYTPNKDFSDAFDRYISSLKPWMMHGAALSNLQYPIESMLGNGVLTLTEDATFAVGQTIQILRTRLADFRAVGGQVKVVTVNTARSYVVSGWTRPTCTGGKARRYETDFFPIDTSGNYEPIAIVRKVGRPTEGYRGRRSVRRV